jgi:outer membrane protein
MVEVTRAQFEAGKGIQASVARSAAELADAQRMLASAKNDHSKTMLDLKRAMGVRWDSEIALSDALSISAPVDDLDANLLEAGRGRPELAAARARLDAARAQTAAARGARRPQVYGVAMADAFAPRDGDRNVSGTIGVTVSIPLMDSGQRGAEARRAEAMERRAEAELKELELRVATEIRQARLDVDTAAANYRAAEAVRESSQAAYDVMVIRVENQKSILVEQLDALATLTEARANLARALFDHAIAMARLDRAIGRN